MEYLHNPGTLCSKKFITVIDRMRMFPLWKMVMITIALVTQWNPTGAHENNYFVNHIENSGMLYKIININFFYALMMASLALIG